MAVPTISSVTPSTGTYAGGTAVLAAGAGFTGTTGVTVDGAAADWELSSDTLLAFVTPAHVAGAARVVVTNATGPSTSAVDYTYTGAPTGLCTLAQVKARGGNATTQQDALISSLIPLALQRLNRATGHEFMPYTTEARTFETDERWVHLYGYDLRSATSVVLNPEAVSESVTLVAGTDYALDIDPLTDAAGVLRLARGVSLGSTYASNFGKVKLTITGAWGCWNSATDVPDDLNQAAIECILSWIDKPTAIVTGYDTYAPGNGLPPNPASWDIPRSAWLKLQPYNRNIGIC
jgi:hypothetical protein